MENERKGLGEVLLIAFMGALIGALAVITFNSFKDQKHLLNSRYKNWNKYDLIMQQVRENYVDSVDMEKITAAAVSAGLATLDPHSIYLPPTDLEESETSLAGNFDGIGIQFNVPNDTAVVLEVIPGGPSEKVGLQPGDRLLRVDTTNIAGVKFSQDSMVSKMRGPSGTKVTVTVQRGSSEIPFEITRGKVPVHCVDAAFILQDGMTGYIRLSKFSRNLQAEMNEAAKKLKGEGMRRLILDLRGNTGGYFDQALSLSNMFLGPQREIVYLEGLHRKREDFKADGRGQLVDMPLQVLIDESTASSSEIFAGAIQDNDRGVIIGRRSFGKGLVQEPYFFTDGSGIRITVARYYTPSGRCIQKPYAGYDYEVYNRYTDGEMFSRDSIKVDSTKAYKTLGGRTVYGGGGIVPDVFVPVDTTRATSYFIKCNRKATPMRFASTMFDKYRSKLVLIDNFKDLDTFLDVISIERQFRSYAAAKDGITCGEAEWKESEPYMLPYLRALVGRYSKLGDNAYYRLYLPVDNDVKTALGSPFKINSGK